MDISKEMAEKATTAYESVGRYLQNDLAEEYVIDIHPQGSFNLGTVVRPNFDADEYDIDLVCLVNDLRGRRICIPPSKLKMDIGNSLMGNERYKPMLDKEGKRCWTLKYSEFHLDVLPCRAQSEEYTEPENTEIELPNKNSSGHYSYLSSNPSGYRKWFRERMRQTINEATFRSFGKYASVEGVLEKVPESQLKTPLQRAIQILKRHRDEFYSRLSAERRRNKPISMIITTLAAYAYNGEVNLKDALENILSHLVEGIDKDIEGNPAIWNPALAGKKENFAEKWRDYPEKESEFNIWLCKARKDFKSIFTNPLDATNITRIKKVLGESVSTRVFREIGIRDSNIGSDSLILFPTTSVYDLFREKYRQSPPARLNTKGWVNISGFYEHNGLYMRFSSNATPFDKRRNLKFRIKTNVQGKYSVLWQVVNTGEEARDDNCLRGDYSGGRSGQDENGFWHEESTAYSGTHYIVCYVLQNGECVAKSSEFVVNVK